MRAGKHRSASTKIAMGFIEAASMVGLSKRFLENAAKDPNPAMRLRTVRVASRRLVRQEDLEDWFDRVSRCEEMSINSGESQAA